MSFSETHFGEESEAGHRADDAVGLGGSSSPPSRLQETNTVRKQEAQSTTPGAQSRAEQSSAATDQQPAAVTVPPAAVNLRQDEGEGLTGGQEGCVRRRMRGENNREEAQKHKHLQQCSQNTRQQQLQAQLSILYTQIYIV